MKALLITSIFLLSCISLKKNEEKNTKIEVVFLNSDDDYPMPVSQQQFWEFKENLDILVIVSKRHLSLLNGKIKNLNKTNLSLDNYDFTIELHLLYIKKKK